MPNQVALNEFPREKNQQSRLELLHVVYVCLLLSELHSDRHSSIEKKHRLRLEMDHEVDSFRDSVQTRLQQLAVIVSKTESNHPSIE